MTEEETGQARAFLGERFPALARRSGDRERGLPVREHVERRFPDRPAPAEVANVWLVGGGSGHGFKHGPAVGEHVCGLIDGRVAAEARFSLQTKARDPLRSVF